MPAVCAALRVKEKSVRGGGGGGGGGREVVGITAEQTLKTVFSCKVLEGERGDDVLLVCETSCLL